VSASQTLGTHVRRWFLISATGFKYVESSKDKTLKLMCLFVDNQLDSSDVWMEGYQAG
jgi:hypothetical protein